MADLLHICFGISLKDNGTECLLVLPFPLHSAVLVQDP